MRSGELPQNPRCWLGLAKSVVRGRGWSFVPGPSFFPVFLRLDFPRNPRLEASLSLLAFESFDDRHDCVPVAGGRRYTEEFVNLAKITDRLQVTAVHPENKLLF